MESCRRRDGRRMAALRRTGHWLEGSGPSDAPSSRRLEQRVGSQGILRCSARVLNLLEAERGQAN